MTSAFSSSSDQILSQNASFVQPCGITPNSQLEYVYDLERCANWLQEIGVSKVCLQFPDNNLVDSIAISQWLREKVDLSYYILGDTSYGSCCVDFVAAEHIPAESIIHFGPACLSTSSLKQSDLAIPVLYVFPKAKVENTQSLVNNIANECSSLDNLILICSCECSHIQEEIFLMLQKKTSSTIINSKLLTLENGQYASLNSIGPCSNHCKYSEESSHQVVCLGRGFCLPQDISIEDCTTLFIGEEDAFLHSLLSSTENYIESVKCFSPQGYMFTPKLDIDIIRRRQRYLVQQVKEASTIGLVLASPGDPSLLPAVKYIRQLVTARKSPPRIYTLAIGKPNPAKLSNFSELDVFVLLACPYQPLLAPATRQQLGKEYYKPIVGLAEVELAYNSTRSIAGVDFHSLLPGGTEHISQTMSEECNANVSLLTGRLLNLETSTSIDDGQGIVAEKSLGQIIEPGATGLLGRSWQGLDPALGQHAPALVTEGRSGVAANYTCEPTDK